MFFFGTEAPAFAYFFEFFVYFGQISVENLMDIIAS